MRKLNFPLSMLSFCLFFGVYAFGSSSNSMNRIDLSGTWKFSFDTLNTGIQDGWYNRKLSDEVILPGTLAENKKGITNNHECKCLFNIFNFSEELKCKPYEKTTSYHFTNLYPYEGAAWYQREITVPESFRNQPIRLIFERSKVTHVWINQVYVGTNSLLSAAQEYKLTKMLTPGKHTITVMVNNHKSLVPTGLSHIVSYDLQTNWNGIIGKMYIEAMPEININKTDVYSNVAQKIIGFKINLGRNDIQKNDLNLAIKITDKKSGKVVVQKTEKMKAGSSTNEINVEIPFWKNLSMWDEFNPQLYRATVTISDKKVKIAEQETEFGVREIKTNGKKLILNEKGIFLRGKNDGCLWPLTGRPPMDVETWEEYFRIIRSYGLNHVRFHSWCPPQAAFIAADKVGIYLQPEAPYWGEYNAKDTVTLNFMRNEAEQIIRQYGNHPSFLMMTLGNELNGNSKLMDNLIAALKKEDPRHLYEIGTNAFLTNPVIEKHDDFFCTARTSKMKDDFSTDVRSAYASEGNDCGMINALKPSTIRNYSRAIAEINMPVIGHEIGQFQVYPDYNEIPKYTGFLKPLNLELYKERLAKAGMADQADSFFKSTGQSALIMYREEIEAALRTPDFGGFQLLDLQDYPGQGTALVGILNSFMETKGIISPERFRDFCNDKVLLAEFEKYCWSTSEPFRFKLKFFNYSPQKLTNQTVNWQLEDTLSKKVFAKGNFRNINVARASLHEIGEAAASLKKIRKPTKLTLKIRSNEGIRNDYPVWVYPEIKKLKNADIIIADTISDILLSKLESGAKVLYFPKHAQIEKKSMAPQFINEFWNWLMFKSLNTRSGTPISSGTMGLLVNNNHEALKGFPTEFHNNWQWWNIMKNSRPLILDSLAADYKPVVQVIDNIDRNHKLGILFEFKVGNGKLLVSTTNLKNIMNEPEIIHYYHSILRYMQTDKFEPDFEIGKTELMNLIN